MEIYYAKGRTDSNHATPDFLFVNNCGYYKDYPSRNLWVERPYGRQDYQLIYLEKGSGIFLLHGHRKTLQSGQVYIFYPNEAQIYKISAGTTFYWMHFTGQGVPNVLKQFELSNTVYDIGVSPFFWEEFAKIKNYCAIKSPAIEPFLVGSLLVLLANISRSHTVGDVRIRKVIERMQENFNECSNADYAAMCDMSEYHFIRKFKQLTGTTPHQYQNSMIIRKAQILLTETNLNISQIAQNLGFEDPTYFSKLFKKETGVSPKQYSRKIYNNNLNQK